MRLPFQILLLTLTTATFATACDRPSGPAGHVAPIAQELAELSPFPSPLPPTPARDKGPSGAPPTPTDPQTLPAITKMEVLAAEHDDDGPTIALHFAAPAEVMLGADPTITLAPNVPFTATWTSPRYLKLRLTQSLAPSTMVQATVSKGAQTSTKAINYRPLRVTASHFRSWATDQREAVEVDTLVELSFSEPLAPANVRQHLAVLAGDDLPGATRTSALPPMTEVPFELLVIKGDALAPAEEPTKSLYFRPSERFQTGRVYRVAVSDKLSGAGGLTVDRSVPRFVLTGPAVFEATSAECGWGDCKPGSTWTVSFSRPLAETGNERCVTIDPPIDPKSIEVSYNSIYLHPEVQRTPQTFRVTAHAGCKAADGSVLSSSRSFDFRVEAPAPQLTLAGTVGVIAVPEADRPAEIPMRVVGTHHVEVREFRIETTEDAVAAVLPLDLSPWADTDTSDLPWGPVRQVRTPGAMNNAKEARVALETVAAGTPGWALVSIAPRGAAKVGTTDKLPEAKITLVQVTNLAITAKFGHVETNVWVTGLTDGLPVANAAVSLLGSDGRVLWRGKTDDAGMARAPVPSVREGHEAATGGARFAVATVGADRAFIDLQNWETRLQTWRFDLPLDWEDLAERPVGLVFTERGIYRPGDTVFVKGHVRMDRGEEHASLAGTKATVTLTNPLGQEALRREVELGAFSDFDLAYETASSSPTGVWHVQVAPQSEAGGASLYGSFRVESFRAPTFFAAIEGLRIEGTQLKADIAGRYYFGAPMAGAGLRWWIHRRPVTYQPPGFSDFTFGTPEWLDDWENRSSESSRTLASGEGVFGEDGKLTLDQPFDIDGGQTPEAGTGGRTWLVELEAEATDADAQVSSTRKQVRIDPAAFYVGVKLDRSFAASGEAVKVNVVAVTPEGAHVAGKSLTWTLMRRSWEHRNEKNAAGQVSTVWERKEEIVSTTTMPSSGDNNMFFELAPPKAGLHFVRVEGVDDAGKKTSATAELWVTGSDASWAGRDDNTVPLVAAKTTWNPGETAKFIVQSPWDEASALVTVESSRILWKKHIILKGRAPLLEIPVTDAMAPNAFVSITLVQRPSADGVVPAPVAQFGYTRLNVTTDGKELVPSLTTDAARYEPAGKVKVSIVVKDKAGRPVAGEATFMAVDESVLALTGYVTPNVHASLFQERALGVRTSDTRSLVLAQRVISDEDMKGDWGGGGESGQATRYRSEFATTAAFLPKVTIGADGKAELEFDLPENLTTFRLMAVVASADGRFGRTQEKIEVQKPLVVRPGLPRFVTAGDMVDINAIVQALGAEARGNVTVKASVSGPAALVGDEKLALTLTDARTVSAPFRLKALSAGTATVAFSVVHDGGEISDAVEMQVPIAHPSAARHAVEVGSVAAQATGTHHKGFRLELPADADPTLGDLVIDIQNSQLGQLMPSLEYLLKYPYGCAEQTTSGTVPLIALSRMKAATTALRIEESEVLKRIQAGVDRLLTMQTQAGGLSYWPGGDTVHPWATAWAAVALVDASGIEGIRIPPADLERLMAYLSELGKDRVPLATYWQSEMIAVRPFAAWVLARAGQPEPANQTALFETRAGMPAFSRTLLALAIYESKRPEGRPQIETLISEVKALVKEDALQAVVQEESGYAWRYTMSSDIRSTALLAMLLAKAAPEDPMLPKLYQGLLLGQRNGRWSNTQDNAFGLLALSEGVAKDLAGGSAWVAEVHLGDEVVLEASMSGDAFSAGQVTIPMERLARANGKALSLVRQGAAGNLYYNMHLKHYPVKPPTEATDRGFTVDREYRFAEGPHRGEVAANPALGDLIEVTLSVSAQEDSTYVAIEDPMPAGFEPVLLNSAVERTIAGIETPRGGDDYEWTPVVFNHTDQRDDRVLLFADQMPRGVHRHRYLVRATSSGTFVAPAPAAHEMYNPWVEGAGVPATVTIGGRG